MTPVQFAYYVRQKTRTNSSTFTDADMLSYMLVVQDDIAKAILKADEDILLIPETLDLVANQREYPQDPDMLSRIKRVEAKLDGSNWLKLTETDITQIDTPIATESDITNRFSNEKGNAFYDLSRRAIYILSGTIPSVDEGLRFYTDTYPAAITDLGSGTDMSVDPSTTTHGIPRALHKLWAMGVIIEYKEGKEKPIALTEREQNYDTLMQKAIEALRHGNLDREVIASVPYDDGSNY